MSRRVRIAVLLGDGGGVGPEMGVKLLAEVPATEVAELLLIADPVVLEQGQRAAGLKLAVERVDAADAPAPGNGRIAWLIEDSLAGQVPPLARSTELAGRAALRSLLRAAEAAHRRQLDGIVFAPLNKHSLRLAGMTHEDELRLLADRFQVSDFVCEFNITGGLWTSRVTSHVPLRDVSALITQRSVSDAVLIVQRALVQAGVEKPRIAVTGLNPHAGDGGSIGREEIEIIEPAVRALQAQGLDAKGPFSPDTVFVNARRGDFDAVVSMYHDQGQIAMKLMGFERGVTLHGGLPIPVTTPASGSAFDIAGQGVARIDGLREALSLNLRMARRLIQAEADARAGA